MKLTRSKLTVSILATMLSACSQSDPVPEVSPETFLSDNASLIDRNKTDISATDASKVAILFSGRSNTFSRSGGIGVIETIADDTDGTPLLYVVNDADGGGYTLVSATKKCAPVLAYSDEGSFNVIPGGPTEFYLNLYKEAVRVANADQSDSLRREYALEWAMFETPEPVEISRASVTDLNTDKQNHIAKMAAKGYRYVGNVTGAKEFLPPSEYQALLSDVTSHANPQYDLEEATMFFLKDNCTYTGPLMSTRWNQGAPFNVNTPNNIAGCVPVAIAQICYYHKYPSKYDWNSIAVNPVLNDAITNLMVEIRSLCHPTYSYYRTGVAFENAQSALSNLGYTVTAYTNPTASVISTQISTMKSPVFLSGYIGGISGHAWVGDGYDLTHYQGMISFIPQSGLIMDDPSAVFYDYGFSPYPPSELSSMSPRKKIEYFHLNSASDNGLNESGWYRYMYVETWGSTTVSGMLTVNK